MRWLGFFFFASNRNFNELFFLFQLHNGVFLTEFFFYCNFFSFLKIHRNFRHFLREKKRKNKTQSKNTEIFGNNSSFLSPKFRLRVIWSVKKIRSRRKPHECDCFCLHLFSLSGEIKFYPKTPKAHTKFRWLCDNNANILFSFISARWIDNSLIKLAFLPN